MFKSLSAATLSAALVTLGSISAASAACYVVYDRNDAVVYRGTDGPIDLSRPIAAQVNAVWPGASLVFTQSERNCSPLDARTQTPVASVAKRAEPELMSAAAAGKAKQGPVAANDAAQDNKVVIRAPLTLVAAGGSHAPLTAEGAKDAVSAASSGAAGASSARMLAMAQHQAKLAQARTLLSAKSQAAVPVMTDDHSAPGKASTIEAPRSDVKSTAHQSRTAVRFRLRRR